MPVTPDSKNDFDTNGWCLVRDLVADKLVKGARERLYELLRQPPDWPKKDLRFVNPGVATTEAGEPLLQALKQPARHDEVFSEIVRSHHVVTACEALLGAAVRLFRDTAIITHGALGEARSGTYFRQDGQVWEHGPRASCNCWIALDPVGPGAGGLGIRPGSHRSGKLAKHESHASTAETGQVHDGTFRPEARHVITEAEMDDRDEVIPELAPGDAVFITNRTWYRETPNTGDAPLALYSVHYELVSR